MLLLVTGDLVAWECKCLPRVSYLASLAEEFSVTWRQIEGTDATQEEKYNSVYFKEKKNPAMCVFIAIVFEKQIYIHTQVVI